MDDMLSTQKNPKDSTKQILKRATKFYKTSGYKVIFNQFYVYILIEKKSGIENF